MNEAAERAPMPNEWSKISEFKQLLIVRALRADRITNALQNYCEKVCGWVVGGGMGVDVDVGALSCARQ
eukprot:1158640-Pelagomonas_calceolata.AAC.8